MRTAIRCASVLLAAAAITSCSSGPTRVEIEEACVDAIAAQAADDKSKPKACEPLPDDDYTTLKVAHRLEETGIIGEDGEVDWGELMEPEYDPDGTEGEDLP